jgi:hypothetical protein
MGDSLSTGAFTAQWYKQQRHSAMLGTSVWLLVVALLDIGHPPRNDSIHRNGQIPGSSS